MKAYLVSGPEYTFVVFNQDEGEHILEGLVALEYIDETEYTFTEIEVDITIKEKE